MKAVLAICAAMFVVLVSNIEAASVQDVPQASTFDERVYQAETPVVQERADRHRRVTCDLLSPDTKWGSLNHAACAAHCLAMLKGYRGGYCDDKGICHCRK